MQDIQALFNVLKGIEVPLHDAHVSQFCARFNRMASEAAGVLNAGYHSQLDLELFLRMLAHRYGIKRSSFCWRWTSSDGYRLELATHTAP